MSITASIDVTKIEKARIIEGKPRQDGSKPKYVNIALIPLREPDQYGNTHMIVQSVSQEERARGVKGPILGNAKDWEAAARAKKTQQPPAAQPPQTPPPPPTTEQIDDDVPF